MLRKYILLLLSVFTLFLIPLSSQNRELDVIMNSFEGLELEEAVENLTFIRKYFEDTRLLELHSTRLKSYEKEEEDILDELPEVFDAELTEKNYEKFFEGLYLAQFYYPAKTTIQIRSHNRFDLEGYLPEIPVYQLNKIWYRDGSMDTITERRFYVDTETPQKVIDSVQISFPYHYMTGYEIYEVKDKLQVEGGEIEIKQKEDNKVVVAVTGRQEEVYRVFALNNEGKPLRCYHSRFEVLPKDYYKNAGKYAKALRKVEKKAGNAKTVEELKNRVKKALKSLPSSECKQENCILVYIGYCEGNVESVLVYFLTEENRIIKERVFTLENSSRVPPLLVKYEPSTEKYGLVNTMGEYVISPDLPEFFQINDYYYALGDLSEYLYPYKPFSLYYLDTEKYEFIELPDINDYIDISQTNSIAIKKGTHYALWDEKGKEKTEYLYDFIEQWRGSELYFVRIEDYYGLIDSEGEIVLPIRYSYIGSLNEEAIARAEDEEKREVFIDRRGRVVTSD